MNHHVSAAAANAFWDVAFKSIPPVLEKKRKIAKFIQQRRKLVRDYCPQIHMEYCFRRKSDNAIIKHHGPSAPVKAYQSNEKYEKLYEMGYIEVILFSFEYATSA